MSQDEGVAVSEEEVATVPTLTPKQVKLIEETWKLVAVDLQGAGTTMFIKLFEIAPELQDLFPFKGEEVDANNESLKRHAMQVMESIGSCIDIIHDTDELVETLKQLGMIHNLANVQVSSFGPVGAALLHTLETGLKEQFTVEVKQAWMTLYGIVQHFMEMGMEGGLEI